MAKNRMHSVSASSKKKGSTHCGTITREDFMRMDRAGRRAAEIAAGHNKSSGTGAHGGDKLQQRRKSRRQTKVELRKESTD